MPEGPLVAVVILHWGSPKMTLACLESVCASNYRSVKIIVVDNCPEQRLCQHPLQLDATIEYTPVSTNTGYCGGNNIGIRRAQELGAKYILSLNNDTIIDKGFIHNCVFYMETQQPAIAVISPKVFFHHKPQHIYTAGAELNIATEILFVGWNERDVGQYDQEREITFAHGCAMFARTTVFELVGILTKGFSAMVKMVTFLAASVWPE